MMTCSKCGAQINDGIKFCPKCGAPVEGVQASAYTEQYSDPQTSQPQYQQQYQQPVYQQQPQFQIPEEYKPISMWGYFGYELLFSIPLVGFILLLIYSFGGTKNMNLKNFARSYFCFLIIITVICIIIGVIAAAAGIGAASYYY